MDDALSKAQQRIAALEAQVTILQAIIDSSEAMIYAKNTAGQYIAVNKTALAEWGVTHGEVIGHTDPDITTPDIARLRQQLDQDALTQKQQQQQHDENFVEITEGSRVFLSRNFLIQDTQGDTIGLGVISRDITRRKRIEAELQQHQAMMQGIFDNTPGLLFARDRAGRYLFVNQTYLDWMNLTSPDQMIGKTAHEVLGNDVATHVLGQDESVWRTGEAHAYETEVSFPTGTRTLLTSKFPLYDTEGTMYAVGGISINTSERKHAEAALRQTQSLVDSIFANMPGLLFARDAEGRFVFANQTYLDWMNLTAEQMIGQKVQDILPPETSEQLLANDRQVRAENKTFTFQEKVRFPTGTRDILAVKFPLRNHQGEIYAVGGISLDITSWKQAEAERNQLQEEIIQSQQRSLQELSTPIIPVMDGILIMPLIGTIDSERARDITREVLRGISQYQARVVIIDVTGVSLVDSEVAGHLNRTVQAVQLKGARTIITGISDLIAETIVDLGIDWSAYQTLSNLQTGLKVAATQIGQHFHTHHS